MERDSVVSFSRSVLPNPVATSHMWVFKFELIQVLNSVPQLHGPHVTRAEATCGLGYHGARHRWRPLPSLREVPWDRADTGCP